MKDTSFRRERVRGRFSNSVLINTSELKPPNPPSLTTYSYTIGPWGVDERMQDTVTPNYKVLSAQGLLINEPMKVIRDERIYSNPTLTATVTHGATPGSHILTWTGLTGLLFDDPAIGPWILNGPRHDLVAQTRELVDAKPLQQSAAFQARNRISPIFVQGLVSLAEMHKTVDMIANVGRTLRDLRRGIVSGASIEKIYQILGGKFPKAKVRRGITDPIYNRWLEYRYGWTPLVMELQGAFKALDKSRKIKLRGTARGKAISAKDQTWVVTRSPMFGPSQAVLGDIELTFDQQETVECRAYAMFEISKDFQTVRDFGFTEIPLAMWELVPYSFVIDWFIPVGDWLEAVTPKLGVEIKAEGITTRRSIHLSRRGTNWVKTFSGGVSYDVTGATSLHDQRYYTIKERVPTLSSALTFPSINVKLNVKRAIDSLALLSQTRGPRT